MSFSLIIRNIFRGPQFMSRTTNVAAYRLQGQGRRSFSKSVVAHQSMSPTFAEVTKPAPTFKGTAVVNGDFKEVKLEDYKGKYLVLFFYPLDFTFVCPTEIIGFSDRISEFKALNAEVVGVSTDSHFSHLAWINMDRKQGGLGNLSYPLLSDITKNIARSYGVLLEESFALRGLFIIDTNSIVRQITINDLPVGRSVDECLRLIKAFQFVEKHGEVCPIDWKEGKATIKPDSVKSKEYFEKVN